jgi:drug/metabolite transporter (DMT)-like permease
MNIYYAGFSIQNGTFWRFVVSTITLLCITPLLIRNYKFKATDLKECLKPLFFGAICYVPGSISYWFSCTFIGTGVAMVIFFTFPVIVIYFNWLFYRKRILKEYYIVIAMIIGGIILLVDIKEFAVDIAGVSLSILSAILYALYIVGSKEVKLLPVISTIMISLGSTITSFVLTIIDDSFAVPSEPDILLNMLGIGIICTAMPILFFLKSVQYISSEKVAIFSVLEPLTVLLIGVFVLKETISVSQSIGIIAILSAAIITFCIKE